MRPSEWIVSNDTGTSSKLIWCVMMGVNSREGHFYNSPPSDPSDFGRCHRLLKNLPQWRNRLPEVALLYPPWKPFIQNWNKMEELYERDHPTGESKELYEFMKQLTGR